MNWCKDMKKPDKIKRIKIDNKDQDLFSIGSKTEESRLMKKLPISENIIDNKILEKEMIREKKKLSIKKDQICFVAVADIARMYWCHQQMIFKIRNNEKNIFASYKEDIEKYGQLSKKEVHKILSQFMEDYTTINIHGRAITIIPDESDINKFDYPLKKILTNNFIEILNKCKNYRSALIKLENELKKNNIPYLAIAEMSNDTANRKTIYDNPLERGIFEELNRAEHYPTFRYHFNWKNYIIEGAPDGIGPDFCYEFKTTANEFLCNFIKPMAIAQANIYSYLFEKPKIKVQIKLMNKVNERSIIIEQKTDERHAVHTLNTMDKLLTNKMNPIPPKQWKCKSCEYRSECRITSK